MSHEMVAARQKEVDRNYEAFVKLLPGLLSSHRGQYALMKDAGILGFYSTAQDANSAAETFIQDGLYSIQHVTDTPIDLGFFSHAVPVVRV
jgi:hypothetical protein